MSFVIYLTNYVYLFILFIHLSKLLFYYLFCIWWKAYFFPTVSECKEKHFTIWKAYFSSTFLLLILYLMKSILFSYCFWMQWKAFYYLKSILFKYFFTTYFVFNEKHTFFLLFLIAMKSILLFEKHTFQVLLYYLFCI
jgi:hypothetical protein